MTKPNFEEFNGFVEILAG